MSSATSVKDLPSTASTYEVEGSGDGWIAFAGVMLLVVGSINFIQGIAAIGNANFFVHNTHYVLGSLNTWGWVALGLGTVQFLSGLGVFVRNQLSRWLGVIFAAGSSVAALLMMPAYPFWALCIFAIDILVIYGLIAHGRRY